MDKMLSISLAFILSAYSAPLSALSAEPDPKGKGHADEIRSVEDSSENIVNPSGAEYRKNTINKILSSISNICDGNLIILTRGLGGSRSYTSEEITYYAESVEIFNYTKVKLVDSRVNKYSFVEQLNTGITESVELEIGFPWIESASSPISEKIYYRNYGYGYGGVFGPQSYQEGFPKYWGMNFSFYYYKDKPYPIVKVSTNYESSNDNISIDSDPESFYFNSYLAEIVSKNEISKIKRPSCNYLRKFPAYFQGMLSPQSEIDKIANFRRPKTPDISGDPFED